MNYDVPLNGTSGMSSLLTYCHFRFLLESFFPRTTRILINFKGKSEIVRYVDFVVRRKLSCDFRCKSIKVIVIYVVSCLILCLYVYKVDKYVDADVCVRPEVEHLCIALH